MMGTTEINQKLDQVFDTMGTDDMESVYFQQKNSLLTMTTQEGRGGDHDTLLNSSKALEVISSSDSDDDEVVAGRS